MINKLNLSMIKSFKKAVKSNKKTKRKNRKYGSMFSKNKNKMTLKAIKTKDYNYLDRWFKYF